MSITDELREEARGFGRYVYTTPQADRLTAIADRIDAEHQKALDEWKAEHGQMWLKGYSECRAELIEGNETLASDLERCGWVKLPLDADGVPWYRGSRVIDPKDPDGKVNTVWIAGDNTLITDEHVFIFRANELRHHRPPTVEDVLREFAIDWECSQDGEDKTAVLKEYAAKLRLAGDGE